MKKLQIATAVFALLLFVGRASADVQWGIGGAVSESYDDNILYSNANPLHDVITRVVLGGGVKQASPTHELEFKGELIQSFFKNHTEFNDLAVDIAVNGRMELDAYKRLSFREQFRQSEEPHTFEDAFGRSNGRYGVNRNRFGFDFVRDWSPQWSTMFTYAQNNTNQSRSGGRDSAQYMPGVVSEYALDSANQVLVGYAWSFYTFEPGGNANIQALNAGYRHYFTPKWYSEVKPGVSFVHSFTNNDFVRPRYEVSLTDIADENTQLQLSYIKEYGVNDYNEDVSSNWRVSLTGYRQLTSRIRGNISAFYGRGHYEVTDMVDKLTGASAGFEYALREHTSFTVDYLYQQADSNTLNRSYRKNRVQAGLKYIF